MYNLFITPLLLGLSSGVYCFVYCLPFAAPVIISKPSKNRENFFIVGKFLFGRLVGYIMFGAIAGYLGQRFINFQIETIANVAMAGLSVLLILYAFGLFQIKGFLFCEKIKKHNANIPLLMGFLMGINICPPFLLSLTYVFSEQSVFKGITYFLFFFIGTTVYFIPIFFLGYLNKTKEFQLAGRISAIIVGLLFLWHSINGFLK